MFCLCIAHYMYYLFLYTLLIFLVIDIHLYSNISININVYLSVYLSIYHLSSHLKKSFIHNAQNKFDKQILYKYYDYELEVRLLK